MDRRGDLPRIEITKMNLLLLFDKSEDANICSVCKLPLGQPCPECEGRGDGAVQCAVQRGRCSHAFHEHCI